MLPQVTVYPRPDASIPPSDFYAVRLRQAGRVIDTFVYVTHAPTDASDLPTTGMSPVLTDRTFSWTTFETSAPVTVTVTKLFGEPARSVEITPRSKNVRAHLSPDGRSATFTITGAAKLSINFDSDDNRDLDTGSPLTAGQTRDYQHQIKHGLMVFADAPEISPFNPGAPGVLKYGPATTPAELASANVIYFAPGVHDLHQNPALTRTTNGSVPLAEALRGVLPLQDGQTAYFAGGSYVYGAINAYGRKNVTIAGRGIISGRLDERLTWKKANIELIDIRNASRGANAHIEGVTIVDPPYHMMVTPAGSTIRNTKQIGWRTNNDGMRTQDDSLVEDCFIKTADDFFYAFSTTTITKCVLWPMWNGATFTLGWGDYGGTGTRALDNDIINPEWMNVWNNNGVLASQILPGSVNGDVVIDDLRIDGAIGALTNLHFREPMPVNSPKQQGEIAHITISNVRMQYPPVTDNQTLKPAMSRIQGVVYDGVTYYAHDIRLRNIVIENGEGMSADIATYLSIDATTTYNVTVDGR